MEARRVKQEVKALLGEYIGQRLRENDFDPMGKKSPTLLDDLAHYDLAISVALWWVNQRQGRDLTETDLVRLNRHGDGQYPNRLEREALILSSFARMILNDLPVKEVLTLYKCKPSYSCAQPHSRSPIVYPFTLSSHPFAMLNAYQALAHSRRHSQKQKYLKAEHGKAASHADPPAESENSTSSSPQPSSSDSEVSQEEKIQQTEDSEDYMQD